MLRVNNAGHITVISYCSYFRVQLTGYCRSVRGDYSACLSSSIVLVCCIRLVVL